jgi:vacuolar protein sorting-associated protein VTA1
MNVPASAKSISPFIKRAEELDRDTSNPDCKVVAYHCRAYAMEKAMNLRKEGGAEMNKFLLELMTKLETEKKSLAVSLEERKLICEKFAFSVFARADEEDRAGNSNKGTARTFYAAGTFFDILEQFGELASDVSNDFLCFYNYA